MFTSNIKAQINTIPNIQKVKAHDEIRTRGLPLTKGMRYLCATWAATCTGYKTNWRISQDKPVF